MPKYSGKCRHLTDEEIQAKLEAKESYSIRFKVPENVDIAWKDLDNDKYLNLVKPFISDIDLSNFSDEAINNICLLFKDQISYGAQITELVKEFINTDLEDEAITFIKENDCINVINEFKNQLINNDVKNEDDVKALIKEVGNVTGNKGKMLFMPIRIAISGKMHGPEIPNIITIFGKDNIINIIDKHVNELS